MDVSAIPGVLGYDMQPCLLLVRQFSEQHPCHLSAEATPLTFPCGKGRKVFWLERLIAVPVLVVSM